MRNVKSNVVKAEIERLEKRYEKGLRRLQRLEGKAHREEDDRLERIENQIESLKKGGPIK